MYKFMMIMLILVVSMSSSSCVRKNYALAGSPSSINAKTGLPFGTVITLGGKKMIVISQENEEVRLKPFVKTSVVGVKAEEPKGEVKPEWESKKVVTEGVKNVQECHNPMGCPQDVKTGECLEGCTEQKVKIEMTETIIEPEANPASLSPKVSDVFDPNLLLYAFLRMDADGFGSLKSNYPEYYGKPEWLCLMINVSHSKQTKLELSKLLYSNPKFLKICNTEFAHNAGANQWTILQRIHSF